MDGVVVGNHGEHNKSLISNFQVGESVDEVKDIGGCYLLRHNRFLRHNNIATTRRRWRSVRSLRYSVSPLINIFNQWGLSLAINLTTHKTIYKSKWSILYSSVLLLRKHIVSVRLGLMGESFCSILFLWPSNRGN